MTRADLVRAELDGLGADAFLVTNPVNVRWLTGFESSNAACLVRRDAVVLATDGRYIEAARAVGDVELEQAERDVSRWFGSRLGELASGPVAFEADHVTVAQRDVIAESGVELVPAVDTGVRLRAVKDPDELERIRAAAALCDRVFERFSELSIVGRTERELAWWFVGALVEEGADGPSFDPIVGSGSNAALPHHHPGDRAVGRGETVVVDAGAALDGYASDCTRTFATGPLPDDLAEAYAVCGRAQEESLAAVRPGADGRDVDAIARRIVEESGLAPVLHGLGHGVGLDVHELPVLSKASDSTLEPMNVVTVEPGVYLAGRGGVRIEDLVIVTEDAPDVLTPFTKELRTLG